MASYSGGGGTPMLMFRLACAAAGVTSAGAVSAGREIAAAARAVNRVFLNMTCLLDEQPSSRGMKKLLRTHKYAAARERVPPATMAFGSICRPDPAPITPRLNEPKL